MVSSRSAEVKPLKVLIVEDQELTRTGLIYGVQSKSNIKIVGEAENGEEALALVEETSPNLVLMDIVMPIMNGITATTRIKENHPEVKIIMLTSSQSREEVHAALAGGADAYCMKNIKMEMLLQVIDMVANGAAWLDPAIARLVFDALPENQAKNKSSSMRASYNTSLTDREMGVLELIVEGKSNKEIAVHLDISAHTVKTHVCNIIQKLSVDDRTQAAVKALQSGLINA